MPSVYLTKGPRNTQWHAIRTNKLIHRYDLAKLDAVVSMEISCTPTRPRLLLDGKRSKRHLTIWSVLHSTWPHMSCSFISHT